MIGKTNWVWVLFFLCTAAFAGNPPRGFTTLEEFVRALEKMPKAKFELMVNETPQSLLWEFRSELTRMDPAHFDRWNKKMKLIHPLGFVSNTNVWLLTPQGPDVTIGYKPELRPQGFASITDFYESLLYGDLGHFQTRAALTAEEDMDRWMELLSKKNQELYEMAILKLTVIHTVGFRPDEPYRAIDQEVIPGRIGFVQDSKPAVKPAPLRSVKDLVELYYASNPEQLRSRLRTIPSERLTRMLNSLRKNDPTFFLQVVEKLKSRTKIGFSTASEPEILGPENPKAERTPIGFTAKPESTEPPEAKTPPAERAPIGFRASRETCSDFLKPVKN